ncbi:MAG: site-specific integrase [Desulfobulbaceae bacterium]|nr:site-specific integrase [Desulfobulbaceae bacterium]
MAEQWFKSKYPGLRYREHSERTTGTGRTKRPLRYYVMTYKWQGKTISEGLGWEGESVKNEDAAYDIFRELKQNRKNRKPPFTLNERNALRDKKLKEKAAAEQAEKERIDREEKSKLDLVFSRYCESNSKKKSLVDEKSYYKNWIGPTIGKKRLDEIVLLDLQRIQKKMEAAGRAPRSISYIKSIVRQIYHYAIDQNLYSGEVPTARFLKGKSQKKFDNKRQRYLSPDQADELLAEIRKHSETTYRVALLSLNSAMRFGEIAGLRWQHIDTDTRTILVMDPKNDESRSVYMTDTIVQMFAQMKRGAPDTLVFPARQPKGYQGEQQQMKSISKVFDRAVAALELNEGITDRRMKIVFHSLRHSCASWLVNAGVELPTIARILGHKSITMTMRYSHVDDETVAGAMAVLDGKQNGGNARLRTV